MNPPTLGISALSSAGDESGAADHPPFFFLCIFTYVVDLLIFPKLCIYMTRWGVEMRRFVVFEVFIL